MNLLPKIIPRSNDDRRRAEAYSAVLRYEAKIGGEMFGPVPAGHRREFFCLDKYTWVWHEEWRNAEGKRQVVATHYTFRPDGILKSQNNHGYQTVGEGELRNLCRAIELYCNRMPLALQQLQTSA